MNYTKTSGDRYFLRELLDWHVQYQRIMLIRKPRRSGIPYPHWKDTVPPTIELDYYHIVDWSRKWRFDIRRSW